jgi:hypothetical protein
MTYKNIVHGNTKIVSIILYTDTKTSLVDEHLGLERITKTSIKDP